MPIPGLEGRIIEDIGNVGGGAEKALATRKRSGL